MWLMIGSTQLNPPGVMVGSAFALGQNLESALLAGSMNWEGMMAPVWPAAAGGGEDPSGKVVLARLLHHCPVMVDEKPFGHSLLLSALSLLKSPAIISGDGMYDFRMLALP